MSNFVNISFPASEQAKFKRWTNSLYIVSQANLQREITSVTLNVQHWAMNFAPVNHGILRSKIYKKVGRFSGVVGSLVNYAPYREFGTGNKVFSQYGESYPEGVDIKQYAIQFKGRGIRQVNSSAQPYLFPAMRLGVKQLKAKLKTMGFKEK